MKMLRRERMGGQLPQLFKSSDRSYELNHFHLNLDMIFLTPIDPSASLDLKCSLRLGSLRQMMLVDSNTTLQGCRPKDRPEAFSLDRNGIVFQ